MENRFYIYKITLLCGSLADHYYYGKHKMRNNRKNPLTDGYFGSGTIVKDYFKKYGKKRNETFIKEIIEFNNSEDENCEREKIIIGDKYKTDPLCLNLKEGGGSGQYSEEARAKISKALKGYVHSEESRKNMSEAHIGQVAWNKGRKQTEEERRINSESHKGIKHTEEWKQMISEKMKGREGKPCAEETKKKLSELNKGKSRTEESRKKQSETLKGRKLRPDWCKHIGEGHRGMKHTENSIELMRNTNKNKAILCLLADGGVAEYISEMDAERKTGISRARIRYSRIHNTTDSDGNRWVRPS